jgi:hypothetical protein
MAYGAARPFRLGQLPEPPPAARLVEERLRVVPALESPTPARRPAVGVVVPDLPAHLAVPQRHL